MTFVGGYGKNCSVFLKVARACVRTYSSFGSLVLSWVLCQFCTCSPRCRVVVTCFKMWLLTWMLLDWTVVLQYWISSCDVMCVMIWNGHWKQNRHTHYCTDKKGTVLRIVCIIFVNELNGMEDLKWHDIWTRTENLVLSIKFISGFWVYFLSAAGEKKWKVVSQFWWRIWDRETLYCEEVGKGWDETMRIMVSCGRKWFWATHVWASSSSSWSLSQAKKRHHFLP